MIIQRGKTFHLRRRVPKRYAAIEDRTVVYISLHTDSQRAAERKAVAAWDNLLDGWEAKLAGDTVDAEARFEAARELAQARGFAYLPSSRVNELATADFLARVEAIPERKGKPDQREAAALLGTVEAPPITVARALDIYWDLARDKVHGKSPDQIRRWKNPRRKAIRNFVEVVGDKPLAEIAPDDMLDFRTWWMERLEVEGLTANSANKDLVHLGEILKTVNKMKRLGLTLPLTDLSLKEAERESRPPFSREWIRDRILAPGALSGLNGEARCIVLGMVNTGYRPSEGAALSTERIRLDVDVPHIEIHPDGRQLKSSRARRRIPLVGTSLEAFRERSGGFPRYRDKPGLSATVNKYLRANGLCETERHTLYSLRHSFEDRILASRVDERIRRDLMGHRLGREKYGEGASLDHVRELLHAIAL